MGDNGLYICFCVDYLKVNEVSQFDADPMPQVDELLDWLSTVRFFRHTGFDNAGVGSPLT